MKRLLFTASALAAVALAAPRPALADLQICISEDGGTAQCSALNTTGNLTFSPVFANFNNISVSSSGFPGETNPDLATTDLSADTSTGFVGTHTLDIQVYQTALPASTSNLQSTFTINGLIGTAGAFAGPSTLQDFTGGSGQTLGTLLHTDTFGAVATGTGQFGPTTIAGMTSDAQEFSVTFTGASQTVTDTIETIGVPAVPEPASLGLLGLGLVGLGAVSLRKRA